MNRLLLIDGSYYVYRSFFAHPTLTNSRGEPTGAIYGFAKTIVRMFRHVQPTHAAVIWDGVPKRRLSIQPSYKQHRDGRFEEMTAQWRAIERMVPMMGIQGLRDPDAESDDLMASYANAPSGEVIRETILATADKDLIQCVNESTSIYSTAKADRPNGEEFALLDEQAVVAKWGVRPNQFADLLALMGDTADGIVGVAGIGEKIGARLIRDHGSLVALLKNLSVESRKIQNQIETSAVKLTHNLSMIRLETDLPLPAPLESLALRPRTAEFSELMRACDIQEDRL